jgi:hypothetical protein
MQNLINKTVACCFSRVLHWFLCGPFEGYLTNKTSGQVAVLIVVILLSANKDRSTEAENVCCCEHLPIISQ